MEAEEEEQVGSDASRTILYAQVNDGQPRMAIDEDGYPVSYTHLTLPTICSV